MIVSTTSVNNSSLLRPPAVVQLCCRQLLFKRYQIKQGDLTSDMANPVANFKTSVGDFSAEIYLDRVPITASNFIDLCQTG